MLTCKKCDGVFPATSEFFRPDPRLTSGFRNSCRNCERTYAKQRWASGAGKISDQKYKHSEYGKAKIKEYNHRPDVKLKRVECTRRYQATEEGKQKRKAYVNRPEIRDKMYARHRNYLRTAKGKESMRMRSQRRMARKANVKSDYTQAEWDECLRYFEYRCCVCGRESDFWTVISQEHWIPLSKGGSYTADNIVPTCYSKAGNPTGDPACNNSKGNKLPEEWLVERFGKRKATIILNRINAYFQFIKAKKSSSG